MRNEKLAKTILEQIKAIRDTGKTNMFMDCTVKKIAEEIILQRFFIFRFSKAKLLRR